MSSLSGRQRSRIFGRRLSLAAGLTGVILASGPSIAAGWTAKVIDSPGKPRVAGLIGTVGDDESIGVTIACSSPEGGTIFLAYQPATRDLAQAPGARAHITVGRLTFDGQIDSNDSAGLLLEAEIPSVEKIVGAIDSDAGAIFAAQYGSASLQISIPPNGLESSTRILSQVCDL